MHCSHKKKQEEYMQFDANGWLDEAIEIDYLNKSMDRQGYKPTHIVLHGTAGGSKAEDIANYFATSSVEASSHFIDGQDGHIVQGVPCSLAAWANGAIVSPRIPWPANINPNYYTISIEHCKPSTDNSDQLTDPQKQSSFRLIAAICDHYGIPKRRGDVNGGIVEHADFDTVNRARCPGPYPWDDLWAFLAQGGAAPVQQHLTPDAHMEQAALDEWNSFFVHTLGKTPPPTGLGIYKSWVSRLFDEGRHIGPPITPEYESVDWNGNKIIVQQFADGRCEWDLQGNAHWFSTNGGF
jgi:N-acetyl-anhydromuramyl-L-alanine amidase AmpD